MPVLTRTIAKLDVVWKKEGRVYRAKCPEHVDKTPSLTLYPDGKAYCFSCHRTWSDVKTVGLQFDVSPDEHINLPIKMDFIKLWHQQLMESDALMYFIQRGFDVETIEREMWGWDSVYQRYVITVWNGKPKESDVVQVRLRKVDGAVDGDKYIGLKFHNYAELYNNYVLVGAKKACLMFGELDAQLCTQHGFPAVSMTNGKGTFKIEWLKYFKDVESLYIVPDRGEEIDAFKLAALFSGRATVRTLPFLLNGSEIKDYTDFVLYGGTDEQFLNTLYGKADSFGVYPYWANQKEEYATN